MANQVPPNADYPSYRSQGYGLHMVTASVVSQEGVSGSLLISIVTAYTTIDLMPWTSRYHSRRRFKHLPNLLVSVFTANPRFSTQEGIMCTTFDIGLSLTGSRRLAVIILISVLKLERPEG